MKPVILALCLTAGLLPPSRYRHALHYINTHRVQLRLDEKNQVRRSAQFSSDARVVRFDQYYRGVAVRDGWLDLVLIDHQNIIVSDHRAKLEDIDVTPRISRARAIQIASGRQHAGAEEAELMIVPPGALMWMVKLDSRDVVFIDARSGATLHVEPVLKFF